jgi:hypothetical protein
MFEFLSIWVSLNHSRFILYDFRYDSSKRKWYYLYVCFSKTLWLCSPFYKLFLFCHAGWSAKTIKELARTPQIQEADFMFVLYIIQVRGCPAILCDSKIIFLVVSLNPQSFSFLRFLLSHLSASFFLTYISLHALSLWSRNHAILEHWKI